MRLTKMCTLKQSNYWDHAQLLTHITIQCASGEDNDKEFDGSILLKET